MDKFLLLLWNKLFLLKVTHVRFDGDNLHTEWVQWGDIEQLIHDCIEEHTSKVTGRLYNRSQRSNDDRLFHENIQDRLTEAHNRAADRTDTIHKLEKRLGDVSDRLHQADYEAAVLSGDITPFDSDSFSDQLI